MNRHLSPIVLTVAAVLAAAIVVISLPPGGIADVRFRQFRDDASRFEGYADRAKRVENLADWDHALQTGREAMKAEWERDAEFKIAAELRAGADTPDKHAELTASMEEARTTWEKDFEAAEAGARGSWYARREGITRLGFDDQWLKDELVKSDAAVTGLAGQGKVDAWDTDISPDAGTVKGQWESSLGSLLDTLRARAVDLNAESQKSYEQEIKKIERELRDRFRLEKNSLVYSHRNRIIWDSLVDHESLRYKSEAESASSIADEILAGTRETLSKDEEKVLGAKTEGADGAPVANFSNLGSDWERQIRELLEKGLMRWQKAQEDLITRMTSWKQGSEEVYRDGDAAWQNAYTRLFEAQKTWQGQIEKEIGEGIEAWQQRDQELAQNLEQSKKDLDAYLATMKGQWEGHSSGLADTMMTGSRIYGEAVDNIEWLTQMAARYSKTGVYATADLNFLTTDWTAWLAQQERLKARLLEEKIISKSNPPSWITAKFEDMTYDDAHDRVAERYTVTLWRSYLGNPETITWYNYISDASDQSEKTPFFYYSREIDRWEQMRDDFTKLVGDAEAAAHDANMVGLDGPGFLRNVANLYGLNGEGENDPYLMTRAEYEYELACREREYWNNRLLVARDVLDYAYAEGPRESAAATEQRKSDADAAMTAAKTAYQTSLGAIESINADMARIKGIQPADGLPADSPEWIAWKTSIEYLSGELTKQRGALAKAEEEYQKYAQALIVLENGQDADFMRREIVSIQSSLLATEKALADKRLAYLSSLTTAEGVDRMAAYAESANDLIDARMRSLREFDAFKAVVTGEESDAALDMWGAALLDGAAAGTLWMDMEERRTYVASRYQAWKDAGVGEKDARKREFAAAVRAEYLARERMSAAYGTMLEKFMDEGFDPGNYQAEFNENYGGSDRAVLLNYATLNEKVLELVESAMKDAGTKSRDGILDKLPAPGRYTYGADNEVFIKTEAARRWVAEHFADIDEAKWDAYAGTLTKELEHAEALVEMYDDFSGFEDDYPDLIEKALGGDAAAQRLVAEYTESGSTLAIAPELAAYDGARARNKEIFEALGSFAAEKGDLFAFSDERARAADHEHAMIDFVNGEIGGGFTLTQDLSGLDAEGLAEAARLMAKYAGSASAYGAPVPAAMLKIAQELDMYAGDLEELLYVRDNADDLDYREVLTAREKGFAESGEAFSHVDLVEEVLSGQVAVGDYGYGDGRYNILKSVLESRNAMSAGAGAFLASRDTEAAADYNNFLTEATSLLESFEIQHMALRYLDLGGGMTLDEYIESSCTGRGDAFRESLRTYITDTCLSGGAYPADPDERMAIALGIGADIDTASSLMEREILFGRELMPSVMEELGAENDTRRREASRARRLVAYHDDPASFSSYRNFLTAMTAGTDGASTNFEVNQGPGYTGMDGRDGGGSLSSMFFTAPDADGRALGSMLIEASNTLALRMGEMFAASRPVDAAGGELRTVDEYLTRLCGIFDPGTTYAYNNGYAFDGALASLLSEASTVKADMGLESLAAAEGEISSLTASLSDRKADIIQRASVYGVMGESKEALRAQLESTGAARNTLQTAYSKTAADLAKAQGDYQTANGRYITQMNNVSTSYSAFQGAELVYERAYAVWEYANTPYLNDTAAREGGAGEGTLPGGETADLTAAPVPDAKERYARVKASFDAAETNMASKKTAMDAQETVAQLSADAQYSEARDEFQGEAESFARTARAAAMIEGEIGELKAQVELWQNKYVNAKENGAGLNKAGMTDAEKSQRDMILGRMVNFIKTNGMGWLIESIMNEYHLHAEKERYETTSIIVNDDTMQTALLKDADPAGYQNVLNAIAGLHVDIRADMEYLRDNGLNYGLIAEMSSNYPSYKEWERKYNEACAELRRKKVRRNPALKRRWQEKRDHRWNEMTKYKNVYDAKYKVLTDYLLGVMDTRDKLTDYQGRLNALDMVRSAKEFRNTTFAKDPYALIEGDRERIFDAGDNRSKPGAGDVNINGLRRMVQRKDIDGYFVNAVIAEVTRKVGDKDTKVKVIQVLDREKKVTGTYEIGDTSVILSSDEVGTGVLSHADIELGKEVFITDYVYSSLNVTGAMETALLGRRETTKQTLEGYAAGGTHDRTVVLRDLESLYHGLLLQAASVGTELAGDKKEIKPRSYEGYAIAVADLVSNGSGTSVDDRIVKDLMAQSSSFQTQNWNFLKETYTQKKQSWMETAAFIRTRGTRDWTDNLYAVQNAWAKWRIETRAQIDKGKEDFEKAQAALVASQERWKAETAVDSADAAAEMLGHDLESTIRASVEAINAGLPKSLAISFDAESLYRDAMKNAPKADLGALAKSMMAANTTAGLTNMLNLGLSGNLAQSFEKQMQAFENGMSVMKNLRMSEVIYNMMDGFDAQLAEANNQNYDTVLTGLAIYYEAPFVRNTEGSQWNIQVVEDYNLSEGADYHTIRFADYQNFQNSTVKLKSLRSLNGGAVDFNDPTTYNMIDARELGMYVKLETDHLNKEIEKVFGNGEQGLFSQHSKGEFDRLQGEFGSAYADYIAGEAMQGGPWYAAPIAPGVPVNTLTLAKVAGSIALTSAGCPWLAFALNSALTGVEAKDGGLTWKQAAVQIGVNAAITYATMGAGDAVAGGAKTMTAQFASAAARSAVSTVGSTLASGIQYNPDGSISYDKERLTDNKTWSQAGLSFATSFAASAAMVGMQNKEGLNLNSNLLGTTVSTTLNTIGSNFSVEGDGGWDWEGFGNIDGQKAVISGAANYVSTTATGGMRDQYMKALVGGMINAYAKKGASELFEKFADRDFGDAYSLDKAITVDTLSISAQNAYMDTKNRILASRIQGDESTKTEKVKVPKEVIRERKVLVRDESANISIIDKMTSSAIPLKEVTIREKAIEYVEVERPIDADLRMANENTQGIGGKILTGFKNAFGDLGTIGTSFAREFELIGKDLGRIGGGIAAGLNFAYEGAKSLANKAINGVKNLFTSRAPEQMVANKEVRPISERMATGIQNWENKYGTKLKLNHDLKIKLQKQDDLNHDSKKTACVYSTCIMMLSKILGIDIDEKETLPKAIKGGAVSDDMTVSQNKLAKLVGLKDANYVYKDKFKDNIEMGKAIVEQLHNGNPVLLRLPGHAELITGYEFEDGELRFKINDPGYQKDKFLDPLSLQPYRYILGVKKESYDLVNEKWGRKAFGIGYFK